MNQDLFRPEVMQSRRDSAMGHVSLAQPLRLWVLCGFACQAAALIVAFLVFGEYTRRSHVTGQLVPSLGVSTVVAASNGVVARLVPQEGDRVDAGDALVRIDTPRAIANGQDALVAIREDMAARDSSVLELANSQIAQLDAQRTGTARQLDAARKELAQVEQAIATRRAQVRLGRETLARYRSIADEKFVSQVQVDQQELAMLDLLHEQQSLERQATSVRRGIAQMEQALQEIPAQRRGQQATMARDRALIRQERVQHEASGALLIKAPVSGLVANRLVEPGQAVQAGQPLLSLLPEGSLLEAQLLVPSRSIGFIEAGDKVQLRYQAYSYQKFGHYSGRVIRVSRSAVTGPSTAGGQPSEPYYRVQVRLDSQSVMVYGKPEPLRPGMLLDADILSERRRLYEWLLEPLYSLRGTVGAG